MKKTDELRGQVQGEAKAKAEITFLKQARTCECIY